MNELGNYLRELRGKKSLRDVTKETGVSHAYLSTLEKGCDPRTGKPRKPATDVLKKLADYYGAQYFDLLILAGYLDDEFNQGFNDQSDATPNLFGFITSVEQSKTIRYGNIELNEDQKATVANMLREIEIYIENQVVHP